MIIKRGLIYKFRILLVRILTVGVEVVNPKLVIASVKSPYTFFTISKPLPPLNFPPADSSPLGGALKMIEPPPSTAGSWEMLEETVSLVAVPEDVAPVSA